MNNKNVIDQLRHAARKLVRELGILQLNTSRSSRPPHYWHTLIEIAQSPDITISKLGNLLLISSSSMSRIVNDLLKEKLVAYRDGSDKREKYLQITSKGGTELKKIDEFSRDKVKGALQYLNETDQHAIIDAINKYASALESNRTAIDQVKIHTLSTSRLIRKQIINLIETIQNEEFKLNAPKHINECILKAESEFYFNNSYNFWYAVDHSGMIIGSVGLKKVNRHCAEIKKYFVHPSYRGKGVAQKLLSVVAKSAVKHQFKTLYLGTVGSLTRSHRFYEKHGFIRINKSELPTGFQKCETDSLFYKVTVKNLEKIITS
jgi:N-acetylglutamate synthase-like GNAT family acetyltransferase/DNA-binding MarR family transcriptional regulator